MRPRVFISAAETSGDRYAASLIHEIRRMLPATHFIGVAGPRMRDAGCEPIDDFTVHAEMLLGAARLAGRAYRLIRAIRRRLRAEPADVAILVDSPALHLPMARQIRRTGCPVLYYVAPQLWAWAPWRIRKVRRQVDRLAAILPFEEAYFRARGVDTTYVGHPLIEQLAQEADSGEGPTFAGLGEPVIACLPGSRAHVIRDVLPGQIEVVRAIAERHPRCVVLFAAAHPEAREVMTHALSGERFPHRVEVGANRAMLRAADLALCASGTATLEVAYHRVPMIVMYNGTNRGFWFVGRWFIHTPHLSLVNILAGRRIVPEFMPYYTSTEPIAAEALDLLGNETRRRRMREDLEQVVRSLGTQPAAAHTARMAVEMIRARSPGPCVTPASRR